MVPLLIDITILITNLMELMCNEIPNLGWGTGSGSNDLHQVHLELVNQSVCDELLNPNPEVEQPFDTDQMICAGNVENGGRDTCFICH